MSFFGWNRNWNTNINNNNNLQLEILKQRKINEELIKIQKQTTNSINDTATSINKYRQTLQNNNTLFTKYSKDIQDKMQLVATRDRMLQLSQERNIYKKKVIYVLFSIIITLLISIVSAYTFFGKNKINK